MFSFFSLLLFFPSITFGLLSAEVFPWGVIFAAFYLRYFSKPMLLLVGLLCASSYYVLITSFTGEASLETDVIRSLAAYMNVILVSQTLLVLSSERIVELCILSRKIFWGLIALGLIQSVGSDLLGDFIRLLVPRGEGSALVESNRGVTLLATEPARAGIELTLIYLIYRLTRPNGNKEIFTDLLVIVFQAFVIKSASSLAFSCGAFTIIYLRIRADLFSVTSTIVFSAIVLLFITVILPRVGGRAGDLVLYVSNLDNVGEVLFYIANESGNRLLALYSFILAGFYHPIGFGVGSWPYSSMTAVLESGLDYTEFRFFDVRADGDLIPFRGPGVMSNLLLDVGIVGVVLLVYLFKKGLLKYHSFNHISKKAAWVFIFKISLFGSPGNPIIFIFFVIVFCVTALQHNHRKTTLNL